MDVLWQLPHMNDFTFYGTGLRLYGMRPETDNTVVVTQWITLFFVPVIPLRRARCLFTGEHTGIGDPGFGVAILERLPLSLIECLETYYFSAVMVLITLGPAAYMIFRVQNRAANNWEFVAVCLSALWPVAVIHFVESRNKRLLLGTWTEEDKRLLEKVRKTNQMAWKLQWAANHYFTPHLYPVCAIISFVIATGISLRFGLNFDDAQMVGIASLVATLAVLYVLDLWLHRMRSYRRVQVHATEQMHEPERTCNPNQLPGTRQL